MKPGYCLIQKSSQEVVSTSVKTFFLFVCFFFKDMSEMYSHI